MHECLINTIEKYKKKYCGDMRAAAMYLYGSGGKGTDDEYSDADLGFIIKDEYYNKIRDELKDVSENICEKIHLWFPEGENAETCNYAFLFEMNGKQFLFDLTIMTEHIFKQNNGLKKQHKKIIFDNADLLTENTENTDIDFDPGSIIRNIEQYWIYTYLNGKYYKRQDIYKLLYIQNFLFNNHMRILNAIYRDETWAWWPSDIKKLPKIKQKKMMIYFGSVTVKKIAAALEKEIKLYSDDAKFVCRNMKISYPQKLEEYVKRHLTDMEVICQL